MRQPPVFFPKAVVRFYGYMQNQAYQANPLPTRPACPSSLATPNRPHYTTTSRTALIARHFSSSSSASASAKLSEKPSINSETDRTMGYGIRKIGAPNTLEHRVFIEKDGQPISAFHDVPLYANEEKTILNMIVEIPRWTNAKMEVSFKIVNPFVVTLSLHEKHQC